MARTASGLLTHVQMQDALLTKQAEHSLRAFVEQAWPILEPQTPFLPNWHLDLLSEYLEAVTAGDIRRLVINVPPRCMKSLLVSVLWPVWEWIQRPGERWIFSSYADVLSLKHSVDRRTVVQSPWYRERWGDRVQLSADQNEKGEFTNTARGHMIATSVGGSILGKGGQRIVVDDPHNPIQIDGDTQREAVLSYFRQTLSTRLDNKKTGAMVVVMQRLHERDLSALCQELEFTHVCLPAEADTRTTIVFPRSGREHVREPGDLLWPAREGRAELTEQQRLLGSAGYAAQYQQHPAPAGGAIFKRDRFRYYTALPKGGPLIQSWDLTFKGGPTSDYVVGLHAQQVGADLYVMDRVKGQWSFTETCDQVEAFWRRHRFPQVVLIEETANGSALLDLLRRKVPGLIAVHPKDSKQGRALAAQVLVESGNVWLPDPRPHGRLLPELGWVEEFVDQLCAFPRGAHDDDVDAFSQLVARHVANPSRLQLPKGSTW